MKKLNCSLKYLLQCKHQCWDEYSNHSNIRIIVSEYYYSYSYSVQLKISDWSRRSIFVNKDQIITVFPSGPDGLFWIIGIR